MSSWFVPARGYCTTALQEFSDDLRILRAGFNSILSSLGAFVDEVAEKFSRVRVRLQTLRQTILV